jgi:protein-disulfide isomerase
MNKYHLSLLTCAAALAFSYGVQATTKPQLASFTPDQVQEIEKVVSTYISKNPELIMTSIQAGMEKQEKEALASMEKAVESNKDKIFKDASSPILGNPSGTQSLVVFMDPYCGFCKKFHKELITYLSKNKNLKVIVKELPIMGNESQEAVKALLAAKNQGKYEQLQTAIYSADGRLTTTQLFKTATSLGIDEKKLEADMKSKTVQQEIDQTLALAKAIGVNGTPTMIIGEKTVVPGFLTEEELGKRIEAVYPKETKIPTDKPKS